MQFDNQKDQHLVPSNLAMTKENGYLSVEMRKLPLYCHFHLYLLVRIIANQLEV
jgi:hypothetical protein